MAKDIDGIDDSVMSREEAVALLRSGREGIVGWNRLRQKWRTDGIKPPDMSGADLNGISSLPALETVENLGWKTQGFFVDAPAKNAESIPGGKIFVPVSGPNDPPVVNAIDAYPELGRQILNATEKVLGQGADFSEMNFQRANFNDARLPFANFSKSLLANATFRNAEIPAADFSHSILMVAQFQQCNASQSNFSDVKADHSDWSGSTIRNCKFANADLLHAKFIQATAIDADLRGASITRVNFADANLSGVGETGFILSIARRFIPWYSSPFFVDVNRIANTQFPSHAQDAWSVLRASYTGPRLLFILVFTVVALLPTIFHVLALVMASRVQEEAIPIVASLMHRAADTLASVDVPLNESRARITSLRRSLEAIEERLRTANGNEDRIAAATELFAIAPQLSELLEVAKQSLYSSRRKLLESVSKLTQAAESAGQGASAIQMKLDQVEQQLSSIDLADSWMNQGQQLVLLSGSGGIATPTRIWNVIIKTNEGLATAVLAGLLLVYNLGRAAMTYYLSGIREAEERNHLAPAKSQYYFCWHLHRFLFAPTLIVSVVLSSLQVVSVLNRPVLVFDHAESTHHAGDWCL